MKTTLQPGMTLLEILVALAMSSIVFLVVSGFLLNITGTNQSSKSQELFEQTKNDISTDLSNAIRWGKVFSCQNCDCNSSSMQNSSLTIDTVVYAVNNQSLQRAGSALTSANVQVNRFLVCDRSAVRSWDGSAWISPYPSYSIDIELQAKGSSILKDTFSFIASNRKQTITQ